MSHVIRARVIWSFSFFFSLSHSLVLEEPSDFSPLVRIEGGLVFHLTPAHFVPPARIELYAAVLVFLRAAGLSGVLQHHSRNNVHLVVVELGVRGFTNDVRLW